MIWLPVNYSLDNLPDRLGLKDILSTSTGSKNQVFGHFRAWHFRWTVESFSETYPFTALIGLYLDKRLQQVLSWTHNRPRVNRYGNNRQKVEPWDCTVVTKDMHRISHSTVCIHFNKRQNVERSPRSLWAFVDSPRQLSVGHSLKKKKVIIVWTDESSCPALTWLLSILGIIILFSIFFYLLCFHLNYYGSYILWIKSCITVYVMRERDGEYTVFGKSVNLVIKIKYCKKSVLSGLILQNVPQ